MQTDARIVDYEKTECKEETRSNRNKGEIVLFGVRSLVTNPIPACEKIDRLFGSGAEVIVHCMCFEVGYDLFDHMLLYSPNKSKEERLRELIDVQPQTGWGIVAIAIRRVAPPAVEIVVTNPPVKTLKGSQKQLIGSFWAGVFSRYFNRQLVCENFAYNIERDEFSCIITIQTTTSKRGRKA